MNTLANGADGAIEKRRQAEAWLAAYPSLSEDDTQRLLHWFRKEASALDIGLLAQNEEIGDGYRRFRADHVDRFHIRDLANGALLTAAIIGGMVAIVYLAL